MTEPIVISPNCRTQIKLAAPLIEATRPDYEQRFAQKEIDDAPY